MGHAMAVTGEKPRHSNSLESFLDKNVDSFGFYEQFDSWMNPGVTRDYKRMVVHFSAIWEHSAAILEFLGIDGSNLSAFPKKKERKDRFGELDSRLREQLIVMYGELDEKMKKFPKLVII